MTITIYPGRANWYWHAQARRLDREPAADGAPPNAVVNSIVKG
jgi:hypothetical protein